MSLHTASGGAFRAPRTLFQPDRFAAAAAALGLETDAVALDRILDRSQENMVGVVERLNKIVDQIEVGPGMERLSDVATISINSHSSAISLSKDITNSEGTLRLWIVLVMKFVNLQSTRYFV